MSRPLPDSAVSHNRTRVQISLVPRSRKVWEAIQAVKKHSTNQSPTRATSTRRRVRGNRERGSRVLCLLADKFQQSSWKSEILTAPEPYGYETQSARSRRACSGATFLWLAAAQATGIWTQGPGALSLLALASICPQPLLRS